MNSTLFRTLAFTLLLTVLAGCAGPSLRTTQTDQAVKSVAVISLLKEQTSVERVGLTVFNNKAVAVDQTGVLNNAAIATVEESLRKARPHWQLKDARGDVPGMLVAKQKGGVSYNSHVSAFQKDLASLANKLDVDLMFVVVDTSFDNIPGRGVGARLRTLSLSSVKDATVYAVCSLVLVDRNGNEVTNRWGGQAMAFSTVPAADLGLDYEMANGTAPETQAKLKAAMQERLRLSLVSAATSMGY